MKYLSLVLLISSSLLLVSCFEDQEYDHRVTVAAASGSGKNLPDYHDMNEVPAVLEERKNEDPNLTDTVDQNAIPDVMEEREKQEEWRTIESYENEQYDTEGI